MKFFLVETSKFIAKIQTHMIENIKINFEGNYKPHFLCNSCKLHEQPVPSALLLKFNRKQPTY